MTRRLLPCLFAALALSLAACGDDEEDVADREPATNAATATTETSPAEPASGCREVKEPEPKKVKVKKPTAELDASKTHTVVMKTSCGTLEIELDVKDNPKTA